MERPIYLGSRPSCLDITVSCVKNYFSKKAVNVNLLTWLQTAKYQPTVTAIRNTTDRALRKKMKENLPAITPSGLFKWVREDGLIKHTGFIQFDIDLKDNLHLENYHSLHEQLSRISNIAYCGKSVSGTGYWGLVRVGFGHRHQEHWEFVRRAFQRMGIIIDHAPKNVCSLRGASYDPDAYYNHAARTLYHYIAPPADIPLGQTMQRSDNNKIMRLVDELESRGMDVTDTYQSWYIIGCNVAATYGEEGRELYHRISRFHPDYNQRDTNYQYKQCLMQTERMGSTAGMGYFIKCCREKGLK